MKEFFNSTTILEKINKGDENTFLEMYNFYAPKLFRHIYYRINSRESAEDVAQQVFCKTWEYITNPEHKIDNLNAFLYQMAHNLIIDYYRKSERKNTSLDSDIGEEIRNKLSVSPSYDNDIDRDLEAGQVKDLLNQLKPEQKNFITWRFFDDLSIGEIAKVSGKSQNAVYVGVHRALKSLKSLTK